MFFFFFGGYYLFSRHADHLPLFMGMLGRGESVAACHGGLHTVTYLVVEYRGLGVVTELALLNSF